MKPARAFAFCLLLFGLPACSPSVPRRVNAEVDPSRLIILQPYDVATYTQHVASILAEAFPGAASLSAARFDEAFARGLKENAIVVIPQVSRFPTEIWPSMESYLKSGGSALFLGLNPFRERVWSGPEGFQSESELVRQLVPRATTIAGLTPVSQWRHTAGSTRPRGGVRSARHPDLPWPAVLVTAEKLNDWDGLLAEDVRSEVFREEDNSLMLFVRGDGATTYLVLRFVEGDGSRWCRILPLSAEWRPVLLHREMFFFDGGNAKRGGPGDLLSFSRVKSIAVGLDQSVAPQQPARHDFGVSEIRRVADPRDRSQVLDWPDLPPLAPDRVYNTTAASVKICGSGASAEAWDSPIQSPLSMAMGWGGASGAPFRWIPVAEATRADALSSDWPASAFVQPISQTSALRFAWVAIPPADATRSMAVQALRASAERLLRGYVLHHAGVTKSVFAPGEIITASAACTEGQPVGAATRIAAELITDEGSVVRRNSVQRPAGGNQAPLDISLGSAPEPRAGSENLGVRIVLTDPTGRDIFDEITQRIKVLDPANQTANEPRVTVNGAVFTIDTHPVYLLGAVYRPIARPADDSSWLDVAHFDGDAVARDFQRLRDAGFNMIEIAFDDEKVAPQLRYVIDEAQRRRLWLQLLLPRVTDDGPGIERVARLLDVAGIKGESHVFAVDIPCTPDLRDHDARAALDPAWRQWLVDQYGSIEHAERVMSQQLWREGEEVTNPPDNELNTDGPHRIVVANYRQFLDDLVSRRCGEVQRMLAREGFSQLFTSRSPGLWSEDRWIAEPLRGVTHQDFISVSGSGLVGDSRAFAGADFVVPYARSMGGKPVLWTDMGSSVGPFPQRVDFVNQARVFESTFDKLIANNVAGCVVREFAGGWDPAGRTDCGMTGMDGSWRPVESSVRGFVRQLRESASAISPWRGATFDRSMDARGARGLLMERDENKLREELRPVGFDVETADMRIMSVGYRPYDEPAPMEGVNAEWGEVKINRSSLNRITGQALRVPPNGEVEVELINTGAATWTPSNEGRDNTVWALASGPDGQETYLAVPRLAPGGRTWVSWTAADPGSWTLRPIVRNLGGFGEMLNLNVEEFTK